MHRRYQVVGETEARRRSGGDTSSLDRWHRGTMAVCIAAGGDFITQLVGVLSVGAFVFAVSWVLWKALALSPLGIRVSRDVEQLGQDVGELGIEAYPEFVVMPEAFDDD